MSRTRESGAYLGGIGTMLGEADVCPSCGATHAEPQFSLQHGGPRECPRVVLGSFPVLDRLELEDLPAPIPHIPAGRKIREFETPIPTALGMASALRSDDPFARPRALTVPWLRPPDLGEVL